MYFRTFYETIILAIFSEINFFSSLSQYKTGSWDAPKSPLISLSGKSHPV